MVTDEGSMPTFLPRVQETEISFRSETASNNASNVDVSKNFRSEVPPINEEQNSEIDNTVANCMDITVDYSKFSENLNFNVAEENYTFPKTSCQKYENVKNSIVYSLPSNDCLHVSSTDSFPPPQSNVTSILDYLEKGTSNPEVRRTSLNHTSSLAHVSYPSDSSRCKNISSHIRTKGYKIHENWNEGISKIVANGTRLLPVKMKSGAQGTEDFDKLTHYLMETSAREFELENVFNPLLFHHLLTSCTEVYIPGVGKQCHIECHHVSSEVGSSAQRNTDIVTNCSDYDGDATLRNVEVDAARSKHLMHIPKENTYDMN